MYNRDAEIIAEAKEIIKAIEGGTAKLSRIALRARRLAQVAEDQHAYTWLRLECEGAIVPSAPSGRLSDAAAVERGLEKFARIRAVPDFTSLSVTGLAQVVTAGNLVERTKVMAASISMLETAAEQAQASRATAQELGSQPGAREFVMMVELLNSERQATLERIAAAIHEWATKELSENK